MPTISDFFPALPTNFIYTLILPFIILFAIFWGLLSALNIFRNNKVNTVLALALTLTIFFTGGFDIFTTFLFQSTTTLAVVIFTLVFIIGIISWAVGRTRDIYHETGSIESKLKRIEKEMSKLQWDIEHTTEEGKKDLMKERLHHLDNEHKFLESKQRRLFSD